MKYVILNLFLELEPEGLLLLKCIVKHSWNYKDVAN